MQRMRVILLTAALCAVSTFTRAGDYTLGPGDTVELSVTGMPDFRQRLTLDLDGQISVGLVGQVKAAGLTVAGLQKELQKVLPTKMVRQMLPGSTQEAQRVIEADEIAVNIVEYAPIYLTGDVAKPGEQRFRPNITVRQVVSLAGGYDILRYRLTDPYTQSADFKAEYETLWTEFARAKVKLARLNAELGEKADLSGKLLGDIPLPGATVSEIITNEKEQLAARQAARDKDVQSLERVLKVTNDQIDALTDQTKRERDSVQADMAELTKLQDYAERGNTTANRVTDARRNMVLSSTRLLQTQAQTAAALRDKEDVTRRIERIDDARREAVLQEIQDVQARISSLTARIRAVGDKMLYAGAVRTTFVHGRGGTPEFSLYRRRDGKVAELPANEDTELEPGDVVEVALKVEPLLGVPVR